MVRRHRQKNIITHSISLRNVWQFSNFDPVTPDLHPHLQQLINDLKLLAYVDNLAEYVSELLITPVVVFTKDSFINSIFTKCDISEIRQHFISPTIPPPDCIPIEVPDVIGPVDDGCFICLDLDAKGEVCGKKSTSYKGLASHRVNSSKIGGQHGAPTLVSLILSNACINCRSVFSCRQAAQLHFRNAAVRGYCIPNLGATIYQTHSTNHSYYVQVLRSSTSILRRILHTFGSRT